MYSAVSSLPPPHDHGTTLSPPDPGKRTWESSKNGYLIWAREQLVARSKHEDLEGPGSSAVGALVARAEEVARVEDVKAMLATTIQKQKQRRTQDVQMDVS